jgi:hypothetical protein
MCPINGPGIGLDYPMSSHPEYDGVYVYLCVGNTRALYTEPMYILPGKDDLFVYTGTYIPNGTYLVKDVIHHIRDGYHPVVEILLEDAPSERFPVDGFAV